MNSFKKEQSKKITFGKIKPQSISSGFRKVFNEAGNLAPVVAALAPLQPELLPIAAGLKGLSVVGKYAQSKIEAPKKKQYSTQQMYN